MSVKEIRRVINITKSVNISAGTTIVTIHQSKNLVAGNLYFPKYKIITWNTYVKDLKAYARIDSLASVPMPEFSIEDSETTKLYKALDIEWNSPRKQLDLLIYNDEGWHEIGSISLLNPAGYPYRIYNLLDLYTNNSILELNTNARLGVRVKEVGYGLLEPTDEIVIHGSCVEELILDYPEQSFSDFVFPQPLTNVYVQAGSGSNSNSGDNNTFGSSEVNNNNLLDNSFLVGN